MKVLALQEPQRVVLVGDIGGTNARLSIWNSGDDHKNQEIFSKTYPTFKFATFDEVMNQFLSEKEVVPHPPQAAALAVAGAVVDNRCAMTNTSWIIDGPGLQQHYKIKVALLNDFEAIGYGVPVVEAGDIIPINLAATLPKAPKVVMGPGTGLGAAQLMWDSHLDGYRVWPGEGAHATFAPRGWKQKALASFVTARFGHCEIEQVACGSGLALIYEFLLTDEVANRPMLMKHAKPKSPAEISAAAIDESDPLAVEAVDMFLGIIGAEAGAMALRCLAKGGVYIAGGVTPKLMKRVNDGSLLEGFIMKKGREKFHDILVQTPLWVITNEKVGQLGACEYARSLCKD